MIDREQMPELIPPDLDDSRIQAALDELRGMILARFPDTTFEVVRRAEPDNIWLRAIADVDDLDEVTDGVFPRIIDMQDEEGLPVYIVGGWPPARLRRYLLEERPSWRRWKPRSQHRP